MADRLSWWVIPGALVVLMRVATLTGDEAPATAPAADAVVAPAQVVVRDAAGKRSRPIPMAGLLAKTLLITLPATCAGETVALTVWRRIDGRREATPWLTLAPRVRADGTLPFAGLAAGCYDVVATCGTGAGLRTFAANAITSPGELALTEATPSR